jgi:hypothetical protein
MMQFYTPIAHSFRSPNNTSSYSTILSVHLSVSFVNNNRAAYLNLIPEGDIKIAEAPALELPQAPSQYTSHGYSGTKPLV